MFTQKSILLAGAALVALRLAPGALAHEYNVANRWSSDKITIRAGSGSFPSGSSWTTALQTAVSQFYDNPSACWIELTLGDTSCGLNNGQSEIWFTDDFDGMGETHRYYDSHGDID